MNKKIVFNYRLAQDDAEKKDPKSEIVSQPRNDLPPILSIEAEKELFKKLESEAKRSRAMSGPNARSDWFSNQQYALQYTQLNNLHKRLIDRILPGKYLPSSPAGSGNVDNYQDSNVSSTSVSGFNNSKAEAKSYEPYLQKVNDSPNGNNLLYLAAISSFGFPQEKGKNMDYLYTEQNKDRISRRLNQITSNHYIQTKFPNIPNQLSDAIDRLNKKINNKSTPEVSSSDESTISPNGPSFGSNSTTLRPGDATPSVLPDLTSGTFPTVKPNLDIDENVSPDAKQILIQIKELKELADKDEESFKTTYKNELKRIYDFIDSQRSLLTDPNYDDMMVIERKLRELSDVYLSVLKPMGGKKVGNSYFVNDYKDLFNELRVALLYPQRYKPEEANNIIKLIQSEFLNKYGENQDIIGQKGERIKRFNTLINKYNNKIPNARLNKLVIMGKEI
jgi:hypothetical protein